MLSEGRLAGWAQWSLGLFSREEFPESSTVCLSLGCAQQSCWAKETQIQVWGHWNSWHSQGRILESRGLPGARGGNRSVSGVPRESLAGLMCTCRDWNCARFIKSGGSGVEDQTETPKVKQSWGILGVQPSHSGKAALITPWASRKVKRNLYLWGKGYDFKWSW